MANNKPITPRVLPNDNSIILLDGGVGAEVYSRVANENKGLWSYGAFYGNGNSILKEIHSDFFKAGSRIATTNTYMNVQTRTEGANLKESASDLCAIAVETAKEARDEHGSGLLAGSLGPLFKSYSPEEDNSLPFDEQVELYMTYMKDLKATDILLFETISSVFHLKVILEAIKQQQSSQAVWLAVTVDDKDGTRLRSGEKVEDIIPYLDQAYVEAILVNCSRPEVIGDSMGILKKIGIAFGAYGNKFSDMDSFLKTLKSRGVGKYEDIEMNDDLGPLRYAEFVIEWIKMGATIVGGCCEIGPQYIKKIAGTIEKEGYQLATFPGNKS